MENGPLNFILVFVAFVCFIVYYDLPSKYTTLEENFGGFMDKSLVRSEFEKSPLHTIVYGATGTGKTYFVKQYLKIRIKIKIKIKVYDGTRARAKANGGT